MLTFALTIALCLTLCSCSGEKAAPKDMVQEFKNEFFTAQEITIHMDITADYGERVYDYRLKYTGDISAGEIEVISPEEIAGLKVSLSPDGTALIYDGAELNTGAITPDGLSPVETVPLMLSAWRDGYAAESFNETIFDTETVSALVNISDDVSLKTWFDKATGLPLFAEISSAGYTVISCKFGDIVIQ